MYIENSGMRTIVTGTMMPLRKKDIAAFRSLHRIFTSAKETLVLSRTMRTRETEVVMRLFLKKTPMCPVVQASA